MSITKATLVIYRHTKEREVSYGNYSGHHIPLNVLKSDLYLTPEHAMNIVYFRPYNPPLSCHCTLFYSNK
ncbi:unnamed protein product [Schistosoma mattheei]|uniref:Uncharacterized protein n=1 Tax=Schistosoma mattheei TaxID=31246 RepID=A0AA85BLT4_9TREM|nr:unnamed protein product [Schistosoma mattheei]